MSNEGNVEPINEHNGDNADDYDRALNAILKAKETAESSAAKISELSTGFEDILTGCNAQKETLGKEIEAMIASKANIANIEEDIIGLKEKLDAGIISVEASRAKIDEIAKSTATTKDAVDINAQSISSATAQATSNAEEILQSKGIVEADTKEITTLKVQVAKNAQTILASRETTTADQQAITTLKTKAETEQSQIVTMSKKVSEISDEVTSHAKTTAGLAEKALIIEQDLKTYEEKLNGFITDEKELKAKIEDLLPGATSASLAGAFKNRKDMFQTPKYVWGGIFVLTLLGLFSIALWYLVPIGQDFLTGASELDRSYFYFILRLAVIGPIVWLALFASRQYGLALRLEEEYAFKEVISKTFEGYKREMLTIESSDKSLPIGHLCNNVLDILAEQPGRIYDKKHHSESPINELLEALKEHFGLTKK